MDRAGFERGLETIERNARTQAQLIEDWFHLHVPKPIDPDELVAVIANLTGRTTRSGLAS